MMRNPLAIKAIRDEGAALVQEQTWLEETVTEKEDLVGLEFDLGRGDDGDGEPVAVSRLRLQILDGVGIVGEESGRGHFSVVVVPGVGETLAEDPGLVIDPELPHDVLDLGGTVAFLPFPHQRVEGVREPPGRIDHRHRAFEGLGLAGGGGAPWEFE